MSQPRVTPRLFIQWEIGSASGLIGPVSRQRAEEVRGQIESQARLGLIHLYCRTIDTQEAERVLTLDAQDAIRREAERLGKRDAARAVAAGELP